MKRTIGVIGCGNMGSALIRGMLGSGLVASSCLTASDSDPKRLKALSRSLGFRAASSNLRASSADVILLAVKPQQMQEVVREIAPALTSRSLLVSIAAGVTSRSIEQWAGAKVRVVRVMPNTPALVGAGISAVSPGRYAQKKDVETAKKIFQCVGEVVLVSERAINAVTAVSGSGPAYFFYLMEELIRVGVKLGLSVQVARRLVIETAFGTGKLARLSGEDPWVLRSRVTSKGGTTEAAFQVFAQARWGDILQRGVRAAAARAKELSR